MCYKSDPDLKIQLSRKEIHELSNDGEIEEHTQQSLFFRRNQEQKQRDKHGTGKRRPT